MGVRFHVAGTRHRAYARKIPPRGNGGAFTFFSQRGLFMGLLAAWPLVSFFFFFFFCAPRAIRFFLFFSFGPCGPFRSRILFLGEAECAPKHFPRFLTHECHAFFFVNALTPFTRAPFTPRAWFAYAAARERTPASASASGRPLASGSL